MLNMFEENGAQFPWKIKIIDFGEGGFDSLSWRVISVGAELL
jgi:hypothetical protein